MDVSKAWILEIVLSGRKLKTGFPHKIRFQECNGVGLIGS